MEFFCVLSARYAALAWLLIKILVTFFHFSSGQQSLSDRLNFLIDVLQILCVLRLRWAA